ncbi:hypothetical protein ACE6H2_025625 [Prunus campanulata]
MTDEDTGVSGFSGNRGDVRPRISWDALGVFRLLIRLDLIIGIQFNIQRLSLFQVLERMRMGP